MKNATQAYFLQRTTGLLLVVVAIWVLFAAIPAVGMLLSKEIEVQEEALEILFGSAFSTTMLITFIVCGLYHGYLGMRSVIVDYLNCEDGQKFLTMTLAAFTFFTGVLGVIFILEFHMQMAISTTDDGEDMTIITTDGSDDNSGNNDISDDTSMSEDVENKQSDKVEKTAKNKAEDVKDSGKKSKKDVKKS